MSEKKKAGMLIDWGMPGHYPEKQSILKYLKTNIMGEPRTGYDWLQQKMYAGSKYIRTMAEDLARNARKDITDVLPALAREVSGKGNVPVFTAQCYGKHAPGSILAQIENRLPHLDELRVISLFPQYADAILGNITAHTRERYERDIYPFDLSIIQPFYNEPEYIALCSGHLQAYYQEDTFVIFNYESLAPEALMAEDPVTASECLQSEAHCFRDTASNFPPLCYKHQCIETSRLIARSLQIDTSRFTTAFYPGFLSKGHFGPLLTDVVKDIHPGRFTKIILFQPAVFTPNLMSERAYEHLQGDPFVIVPWLCQNKETVTLISEWITT